MKTSENRLLNYAQRLRRLRCLAIGFLLLLLIPLTTLVYFGFEQTEQNLLNEYQREASRLVEVTNRTLFKRRMLTNTLPKDEFDYYHQVYNPITKQSLQVLSPLSQLEVAQPISWLQIEGLVGYFQYNSQGHFNSPIWPYSLHEKGLSDAKLLGNNTNNARQPSNLNSQLSPELTLELTPELAERQRSSFELYKILSKSTTIQELIRQGFKVDKELFHMSLDVPDYLIFYRIVSVAEQNRLQGYLVKRGPHFSQVMTEILEDSRFDSPILMEVKDVESATHTENFVYQNLPDGQTKVSQPRQFDKRLQQYPIYKTRLRWPYGGYVVSLSTSSLPMTPAMVYGSIIITVLIAAILSACYGFYQLGVKQLALGEQRLNFVSSVSHELKTPLTSIQMYSQMLKEGTVISATHQQKYFEFIYGESERLSRLINNILQLSTLSNQQQNVQPEYTPLAILLDNIRSKTSSLIDKHNFQQNMIVEISDADSVKVLVEQDAFSQVIINITDNAVKFFNLEQINDPSRQKIDFIFRQHPKLTHMMQLEIRDYGEGITVEQESKIFDLFYRGGNELTRTTQGTGIGLALVNGLVLAQEGNIVVERRSPGLAMLLSFKTKYG